MLSNAAVHELEASRENHRTLADDSEFRSGGSVFTADEGRGRRVETGMMFVNNIARFKDSGYGRELGELGIQASVDKKLVHVRRSTGSA